LSLHGFSVNTIPQDTPTHNGAMTREFVVEFQCSQCGAPASIAETTRLFRCRFCGVKTYLVPRKVFHYVLHSRAPENKDVVYFPYYWFRGVLFVCLPSYSVHGEVIDEILQASPSDYFPLNLGFKTQVTKVRFMGPGIKARIFPPTIPFEESGEYLKAHFEEYYYSEFIGSLDLIYAPFYLHDQTVYDGISNKRVDQFWDEPIILDQELISALPPVDSPQLNVKFLTTLCPQCGWDMDCAPNSYLIACTNCSSFWKPGWNGFKRLGVGHLPGDAAGTALFLPFWRVRPEITGIQLNSHQDLIKAANLTRFVEEEHAHTAFYFWIPAFKIDSRRYLQIAKRVTISQPQEKPLRELPKKAVAYPVTLPISEALKGLKSVLADFVGYPEIYYPKLEEIEIVPKRLALVYIPFQMSGSEFIHPRYKVQVSKTTLDHFRQS
jgi:DNA-directed RNA polymerase subunit RPC12/RpoP